MATPKKKRKFKVTATTPEARAFQKKLDNPKIQENTVFGGPRAVFTVARGLARRSNAKDKLDLGLDAGETLTDNKKPGGYDKAMKRRKKIKVKRRPQGHA